MGNVILYATLSEFCIEIWDRNPGEADEVGDFCPDDLFPIFSIERGRNSFPVLKEFLFPEYIFGDPSFPWIRTLCPETLDKFLEKYVNMVEPGK